MKPHPATGFKGHFAPRIVIFDDPDAVADYAADQVASFIEARASCTLGLATGLTMTPIYQRLTAACRSGFVSFRDCSSFNLDELVGPKAYFSQIMHNDFFGLIDIDPTRARLPNGTMADLTLEAENYENEIQRAGGIDLQLLGMGRNGHIGFNEPGSDFASRTRVVDLAPSTREALRALIPGPEEIPAQGLTMGVATILGAREILLVATGSHKTKALAQAVEGPLDQQCPASVLRLHPAVTIVCDIAAASLLRTTSTRPSSRRNEHAGRQF